MNKRNAKRVLLVLENSYNTIKNKKNWTQGAWARTRGGRGCDVYSNSAQQFCAVGAIEHFSYRALAGAEPKAVSAAIADFVGRVAIEEVEKALSRVSHRGVDLIMANDLSSKYSHKRVLRGFRNAISSLRKRIPQME